MSILPFFKENNYSDAIYAALDPLGQVLEGHTYVLLAEVWNVRPSTLPLILIARIRPSGSFHGLEGIHRWQLPTQ